MQTTTGSSIQKWYALITALLGWFAVITQFILLIENSVSSVTETIIRFFSYFTILTNILVAIAFSFVLLQGDSKWARFFNRPATLTAISVYIIVVGAVYNIVLRMIWHPVGLQKLVDELVHSVIPLLAVLFWFFFVQKSSLQWKNSLSWLIYPLLYSLLIGVRGALSGFYPYPFVNVPVIGYPRALLNGALLALVFLGLSLFLIAIARFLSRKQASTQ